MKYFLIAFLSFSAFAGKVENRKIHLLFSAVEKPLDSKGPEAFFIYFEGNANAPAKCSKNQNRFAINPKTDGGKAAIQLAMFAHQNNRSVTVIGTDKCTVWGDTEDLRYFHLNP